MKKILCYSGGKDSTAMLLYLQSINAQIDEVLYVDVGDWIWESSKEHLKKVEEKCNIKITVLNIEDKLKEGFKKWGFPSFFNRWCTGEKREVMRQYLRDRYGEREHCAIHWIL